MTSFATSMHQPQGVPMAAVWLPWLLSPLFLLLPVGGCGAAAALRRATRTTTASAEPGAAALTRRPHPDLPAAGAAPVAAVVTVIRRHR